MVEICCCGCGVKYVIIAANCCAMKPCGWVFVVALVMARRAVRCCGCWIWDWVMDWGVMVDLVDLRRAGVATTFLWDLVTFLVAFAIFGTLLALRRDFCEFIVVDVGGCVWFFGDDDVVGGYLLLVIG